VNDSPAVRTWLLPSLVALAVAGCGGRAAETPRFVGSASCASCHATQYAAWQASQHAVAMQPADSRTVLARFDSTRFVENGVPASFFRRGSHYFTNMVGPDGQRRDYQVDYTFGVSPLQQYLVKLTGGRMQALTAAWDSRPAAEGGQRWFSLNPAANGEHVAENHWSARVNNWNFRCADCHSTAVRKNFDPDSNRFDTKWSEISVGCEGCHGPGSAHAAWGARSSVARAIWKDNALPNRLDERRNVSWTTSPGAVIAHRSVSRTTDREIETCAQCHARRIHIADGYEAGKPFLDSYIPFMLDRGAYFPDGQQLDEVYNYGSFLQSRMYRAGVTCSDCHDPHTQKLRRPGAQVCAQCHDQTAYSATNHYQHGPQTGVTCLSCHMPPRTYMVIDPRRDHSMRVPRPDLSVSLGVPNACTQCHVNRDPQWAVEMLRTRFPASPRGPARASQRFAHAFAMDDDVVPGAADSLVRVAGDPTEAAIVRASALSRLFSYPDAVPSDLRDRGLRDSSALVRLAALQLLDAMLPEVRVATGAPLLRDRYRAIRQGAAFILAPAVAALDSVQRRDFDLAAKEFVESQRYNADQPEHRWSLGGFYLMLGRLDEGFAELRAAASLSPNDATMQFQLGRLLADNGRVGEAIGYLERAVRLRPGEPEFARRLAEARAARR
jgi:predicted CXXCH cytochrome family protein